MSGKLLPSVFRGYVCDTAQLRFGRSKIGSLQLPGILPLVAKRSISSPLGGGRQICRRGIGLAYPPYSCPSCGPSASSGGGVVSVPSCGAGVSCGAAGRCSNPFPSFLCFGLRHKRARSVITICWVKSFNWLYRETNWRSSSVNLYPFCCKYRTYSTDIS